MMLNNIIELAQEYDEAGNVNHETVLDGAGNRTLHPDGWCERRTLYDEKKQKTAEKDAETRKDETSLDAFSGAKRRRRSSGVYKGKLLR